MWDLVYITLTGMFINVVMTDEQPSSKSSINKCGYLPQTYERKSADVRPIVTVGTEFKSICSKNFENYSVLLTCFEDGFKEYTGTLTCLVALFR